MIYPLFFGGGGRGKTSLREGKRRKPYPDPPYLSEILYPPLNSSEIRVHVTQKERGW